MPLVVDPVESVSGRIAEGLPNHNDRGTPASSFNPSRADLEAGSVRHEDGLLLWLLLLLLLFLLRLPSFVFGAVGLLQGFLVQDVLLHCVNHIEHVE